jgi:DNA-binding NtrC family response regulator
MKRVLLVDDASDLVEVIEVGLTKKGYEVDAFSSPSTALTAFVPGRYDVVILDVRMIPLDGFELHRRLRKLDPRLPALFLTAYGSYVQSVAEWPGRVTLLEKPISLSDLVIAIEKARP